ncbi:sugar ABC transporter permease [Parasalinivibrio latis]|uniref:carbohydrate ABC transporter permease n=1 Tax=Parasalinivibrio latis TaxID=2952610 RepID=UPI0030E2ABB6
MQSDVTTLNTVKKTSANRRRTFLSDRAFIWIFPVTSVLLVFAVYPFFYNIYLSLHEFSPMKRSLVWVGTENWVKAFEDARMWSALSINLSYTFICLSIQVALGMGIALLLDSEGKGYGLMRGLMTLPLVVPPAVTGMMFMLLEDPQWGIFSWVLSLLHILSPETPILATPDTALAGVMIADIWQWTPFMVLIFIAGLRSLPKEPFESAMLDGASSWLIFRHLTLPMMGRVIAVAVLIRGIDLFRVFDYVYVMTSGGPGTATYTLSFYSWQQTFGFVKWGYGATLSLIAMVMLLVLANLFIKLTKLKW